MYHVRIWSELCVYYLECVCCRVASFVRFSMHFNDFTWRLLHKLNHATGGTHFISANIQKNASGIHFYYHIFCCCFCVCCQLMEVEINLCGIIRFMDIRTVEQHVAFPWKSILNGTPLVHFVLQSIRMAEYIRHYLDIGAFLTPRKCQMWLARVLLTICSVPCIPDILNLLTLWSKKSNFVCKGTANCYQAAVIYMCSVKFRYFLEFFKSSFVFHSN